MNQDQERQAILREMEQLRVRLNELDGRLKNLSGEPWQAREFYLAYYATTGAFLGMFAALASLMLNVAGSALVGQHPLRLIQEYLTFPLGEKALQVTGGLTLLIGCCLYIATGMLLGIIFQVALARLGGDASLGRRLLIATVLAIAVWLVNFYGILSWLQPLLFGGNWIVERIPPWIAVLTHLVFGWTMALIYPWGVYTPYRLETQQK